MGRSWFVGGSRRRKHRGFRRRQFLPTQFLLMVGVCLALYMYKQWSGDVAVANIDPTSMDYYLVAPRLPSGMGTSSASVGAGGLAVGGARHLQEDCKKNKSEGGSSFPDDAFSFDERKQGAIILHVLCMCYMFVGLAIICDDFFEASLSAICEGLNLQKDVAGATFMAAGGSAPELFTSVVGVFIAESDIGFGTIVGSAVFNVLFVIGVCAWVGDNLAVTWWPLTRDSVYYCFSICVLVLFVVDQSVKWWEALILLICYIMYVVIMKFNIPLEIWFTKQLRHSERAKAQWQNNIVWFVETSVFNGFIYLCIIANVVAVGLEFSSYDEDWISWANLGFSIVFIVEMLVKICGYRFLGYWRDPMNAFDGVLVCLILLELGLSGSGVAGSVRALRLFRFFRALRSLRVVRLCKSLARSVHSLETQTEQSDFEQSALISMDMPVDSDDQKDEEGGDVVTWRGKSRISLARIVPEELVVSPMRKFRKKMASGTVVADEEEDPDKAALLSMDPEEREGFLQGSDREDELRKWLDSMKNGEGGFEERVGLPPTTEMHLWEEVEEDDEEESDDEPCDPFDVPDGCFARFMYVICFPLVLLFWLTIPDCRRERFKKWYFVTLIACVMHIGMLSFIMVWMATLLGEVLDIPEPVMGLTLLAAGTSIPDALSSMAVARRGEGDMAVSSSIGSNIFDILIGLPVPWLLFTIIKGEDVEISSDGLTIMVLTLFIMVAFVILIIHYSGWILTDRLGWIMVFLYFLFVTESLLLEYGVILDTDDCD